MLPTYTMYLDYWDMNAEVYGKVTNWDDMCKLNDFHAYNRNRAKGSFMFVAIHPEDSVLFPYVELQEHLHAYSHIPELTSDQIDQLIFIHSLDQ